MIRNISAIRGLGSLGRCQAHVPSKGRGYFNPIAKANVISIKGSINDMPTATPGSLRETQLLSLLASYKSMYPG